MFILRTITTQKDGVVSTFNVELGDFYTLLLANEGSINDITTITGYTYDEIKKFIKDDNLHAVIIYNDTDDFIFVCNSSENEIKQNFIMIHTGKTFEKIL